MPHVGERRLQLIGKCFAPATPRFEKSLRTSVTFGGVRTSYLWDVNASLPVIISDTTSVYVNGLSLIARQSGVDVEYYHTDALGSVRNLTNGSGQTVGAYSYRPFGEPSLVSGTSSNRFRYTGQMNDPEAGLYFLRARYYELGSGRFLTRDPFRGYPDLPQSLNLYPYVRNNPLAFNDPGGYCPKIPDDFGSAICFALFIKTETASVIPPVRLHGDNRDFGYSSDPKQSRFYVWISTDGSKEPFAIINDSGTIVEIPLVEDPIEWTPPSKQNTWSVTSGENCEITVNFDLVVSGRLEKLAAHINGTVTFHPNGLGGYSYSGERDGYPWAEAYYRDAEGSVRMIFQRDAVRSNPDDLDAIEYPTSWWDRVAGTARWLKRGGPREEEPPQKDTY